MLGYGSWIFGIKAIPSPAKLNRLAAMTEIANNMIAAGSRVEIFVNKSTKTIETIPNIRVGKCTKPAFSTTSAIRLKRLCSTNVMPVSLSSWLTINIIDTPFR